jgi:PQQ-dependent catabolism-associated CXXCW motif protein
MFQASIKPAGSSPLYRRTALGLAAAAMLWIAAAWSTPLLADQHYRHLDPKTGYRMGYYRAPTPPSAPGATRLDRQALQRKIANKEVLLIDVIAHVGAGYDPITGEWYVQQERRNIPGSVWLADVGGGHLTPVMARYFEENLEKLTGGDRSRAIVIYCQADCWMGWNAVKRAVGWGYKNVYWYPEGTDDWSKAGLPLEAAAPVPVTIDD